MDRAVDRASTAPISQARPGDRAGDPASEGECVSCCIAGCGPAGAMLGLLLARRGVDVLVLEKHGDFFRDFPDQARVAPDPRGRRSECSSPCTGSIAAARHARSYTIGRRRSRARWFGEAEAMSLVRS